MKKKNNSKIKKIVMIFLIVVFCIGFNGCESTAKTVDSRKTKQQEQAQKDMDKKVKDPKIIYWTEANNLSWLYELRDDPQLKCYYYTRNQMSGKYVYEGTCIGYGIPYSAQYSNPEKIVEGDVELGYDLLGVAEYLMKKPQAEPNGIFMPESSSATWVIKTDPDNPKLMYAEYQELPITVTKYKKPRSHLEPWSLEGVNY